LLPGDCLVIETRDWICHLEYRGEYRAAVYGHAQFCPDPVEVSVAGSTWGGSLLKLHFIGRGMHLEFFHPVHQRVITSRIVEIRPAARCAPPAPDAHFPPRCGRYAA